MSRGLTSIAAAAVLLASALAVGIYALAARPDMTRGDAFLFSDEGHNLLVTAVLEKGGRLYQDVFTPYGPLTAWSAEAAARIGGNTPRAYEALHLALNTGALLCLFAGLLRVTTPGWALLFVLSGLLPSMLAPGSLLGGLTVSSYVALERLAIAIVVGLWRPPGERSVARSIAIGAVAGACQWIRFGGALLVLAGVLCADAAAGSRAADRRARLRQTAAALLGAAGVEAALAVWAWATLPPALARDLLWPSYFTASYAWVTPDLRWPAWPSWRIVIAQYGPAIAGALLGVAAIGRARASRAAPFAVLLLGAYLAGVFGLFRHVHHFRQYAWLLAAGGAYAAAVFTARVRAALVLCSAPALAVMLHALVAAPSPGVWRATPSAGAVYLSAAASARVDVLNGLAAEAAPRGGRIIAGPHASGWYAAFDREPASRHTWFLDGVVRPWEAPAVSAALTSAYAIAMCPSSDASLGALHLPADLADALARVFTQTEMVAPDCVVHLRDAARPASR